MTLINIGFWGSFCAGVVLMIMCALGAFGFARRARWSTSRASSLLHVAIVLGFVSTGINALYWQVIGQILIASGLADVPTVRLIGSYLDIVVKSSQALAVVLHLAAWRASLDPDDRRKWSVLGMAFYPHGSGALARFLNGFCREGRK